MMKISFVFSGGSEDKCGRLRRWEKAAHEKDIHLKMTEKILFALLIKQG